MIQQYRFIARLGWGTFGVPQSPRPSVPYSQCVQCDSCLGRGKTQQFRPIVVAHLVTALHSTELAFTMSYILKACTELSIGWVGLGRDFSVFGWLGWVGSTIAKVQKTLKDCFNAFKARLDKIWLHQAVKFDFMADLTGTGN